MKVITVWNKLYYTLKWLMSKDHLKRKSLYYFLTVHSLVLIVIIHFIRRPKTINKFNYSFAFIRHLLTNDDRLPTHIFLAIWMRGKLHRDLPGTIAYVILQAPTTHPPYPLTSPSTPRPCLTDYEVILIESNPKHSKAQHKYDPFSCWFLYLSLSPSDIRIFLVHNATCLGME